MEELFNQCLLNIHICAFPRYGFKIAVPNSGGMSVHRRRIVRWFHSHRGNQFLLSHTINTRSWINHIFPHRHQLMAFQSQRQHIIHLVLRAWVYLARLPLLPLPTQPKTRTSTTATHTIRTTELLRLKIILTLPAITANQITTTLHRFDTKRSPSSHHRPMATRPFSEC